MRLIFLDIDGVLNHADMRNEVTVSKYYGQVSSKCVGLLNDLTNKTGAKIVVSSTWRKDSRATVPPIGDRLAELGVTADVVGQTPVLTESGVFRGNEIYKWMLDNPQICGSSPSKYRDYVILDDDSDMLLWQQSNFVQTDAWAGITPTTVYRACQIFGVW